MKDLLLGAGLALSLGGCCHDRFIDRPVPIHAAGCLTAPPPAEAAIRPVEPDGGCPRELPLCLDVDGALALEGNLRALRRYAQEAWLLCGDRSAGGPDGGR